MCGISGFSGRFEPRLLGRMNEVLAHRGPDDEGTWWDSGCGIGLAHRRLSIIDLSDAGHQPMWDPAGRVVIVFNGEIFNYRALREQLLGQGFAFTGHSDTEVLLNLYLRDGTHMLERLNGMFAFALWDPEAGTLFLARDGVGVKPLYYAQTEQGLVFASEIKALLLAESVDRAIDPLAVQHHLAYLWCPAPRTMLRGVRKLEPGHALEVRDGRIARHWQYYDLPYGPDVEDVSPKDAALRVREAVKLAVRRQMVADVPVGAFLSGGLDSSAVVAFAAREPASRRLQCFTIGFRGGALEDEGFAEDLPYARRVAAALGVDLHTVTVGPEMIDQLETMIWHLDEPQADPAPLNVLFISRLAREQGIKVLLSGVGGDDLFTGYRRHLALRRERLWAWLPEKARRLVQDGAGRLGTGSPMGRRVRRALRYAASNGDDRIASYFLFTEPQVLQDLYGPAIRDQVSGVSPLEPLRRTLSRLHPDVDPLQRMLYLEGKHFLADHNLNYADKMSMAAGVEVRVPLLDPDLIALAARLPTSLKQHGVTGKWIFKKAMEPMLPRDVIYRPKTGFGAPLRRWLRHELRPLVDDLLSEGALVRRGLFDPGGVRRLREMDARGEVDGSYTIFSMLSIELWCRILVEAPVRVSSA